jgi:hypothetical protein
VDTEQTRPDQSPTTAGLFRTLVADLSLPRVQSFIAVLTGLITIIGALYSFMQFMHPGVATGEVVAVVQDAASRQAVSDAAVEILTLQDALVVSLTPDASGRVRQSLKEGAYQIRVSHPSYSAESRKVQVVPKRTVELRMNLRPGSSAPLSRAKDAITGGVKAVGHKLGF